MAAQAIPCTYNSFAIGIEGIVFTNPTPPYFYTDPVALTTFGFVVSVFSVWTLDTNIQEITWTPCDCDYYCNV